MLPSPFGSGPDSSPNNPPIFVMNIVITIVLLAIIASPFVNAIRRALLYRYLRQHGTRVDATITNVWGSAEPYAVGLRFLNLLPTKFGLDAKGIDPTTGEIRIFTYRGRQRPFFTVGHHVTVLIDPRTPGRYAFLR